MESVEDNIKLYANHDIGYVNLKQIDRNKSDNLDINNNTLELNCNKMPFANDMSKLSIIQKKQNVV